MKKREKSNNVLKLLIMIFAITILVARVGSVKGVGGGGSSSSPAESTFPVIIAPASPTDISGSFIPSIGSTIAENHEAFLGRMSKYTGSAIGTPGDTIKWRVTVTGPANKWLTVDMVDLDEVGWEDLVNSNIQTFHYPLKQSDNNLVALGSCDDPDTHANDCLTEIGFSLDDNDVFTNADRIEFNSNAPDGSYIIRYELVDTFGTVATADDQVLSNAYEVQVTLDTTGPEITDVSNNPVIPTCSDNPVSIFATVADISGISRVWFNYNVSNEFNVNAIGFRMDLIENNLYKGEISLPLLKPERDDGLEISYEVVANDTLRNLAKSLTFGYTYDCLPPTANANGPYTGQEGSQVTFDASDSSDTASEIKDYEWDFGDSSSPVKTTNPVIQHTYADNGNYTVTLKVTDNAGNSATNSTYALISNVAPTANANGPYFGDEGSPVEFTCTFEDPGVNDNPTCEWDFGDGSDKEIGEIVQHTYLDNGSYNVLLTVTDKDGGIGTDTTTATISNLPPVVTDVSLTQNPSDEGQEVTLTALFTDAGVLDKHTAKIDWGDSTITNGIVTESDGSAGTISGSHIYIDNNDNIGYEVTVTVTDEKDSGSKSATQDVRNVAPTANANGPYDCKEGEIKLLSGSATDPGADELTYEWDLDGDGNFETPGQTVDFKCVNEGAFDIALRVTDDDNGMDTDPTTVDVSNVAPSIEEILLDPNPGQEGTVITLTALFTNPGVNDTHTATIDWGDGTDVDVGTVNEVDGIVKGSHNYTGNGTYEVTVKVMDEVDSGSATTTATISDGTPTANFTEEPTSPEEGQPVKFTDTSTSPADAIVSWHWDFGDGSTSTERNPTHTYKDDSLSIGSYTVTLTVTDEDGSTDTTSEEKVVRNSKPVVTAIDDQITDEGKEFSGVVATFTDAGIEDVHRMATIDWGDGTVDEIIGELDGTVVGSHVYVDNNGYTVNVTVWDDSFDYDFDTFIFTVNNVAPEVIAIADQVTDKETGIGSVLANFTDAGILDDHTAIINWGDGTPVEDGIVNEEDGSGTVSSHHKYNRSGLFTITITVMDEFDSASDSLNAKVGDLVIDLNQGWNLFSVPKVLESNNATIVLADLDPGFAMILTYENNTWIQPTTIDPLRAYWIKMNEPGKLLLTFRNITTCTDGSCIVPGSRELDAGWQLIGFTDTKPLMSRLALKSIEGSYSQWFGFVNNIWISQIFGQWPDKNLEPGLGYWVFMTKPSVLAVLSL